MKIKLQRRYVNLKDQKFILPTFAILFDPSYEKLVVHQENILCFISLSLVSDLRLAQTKNCRTLELKYDLALTFFFQDLTPKTIRQVPSWSSLSSSGSSLSRPVSSASSFEKFRQQARDKEERVN